MAYTGLGYLRQVQGLPERKATNPLKQRYRYGLDQGDPGFHSTLTNIHNSRQTLLDAGIDPGVDDYSKIQPKKKTRNSLDILVDVLNTPNYAIAGFFRGAMSQEGDALNQAWKGMTWQDRRGFASVLAQGGIENKQLQGGLGLALDIGLDPTTYLTAGWGASAKSAARLGLRSNSAAKKKYGMELPQYETGHTVEQIGFANRTFAKGTNELENFKQSDGFLTGKWKEHEPIMGFAKGKTPEKGWEYYYNPTEKLDGKLAKSARDAYYDQGGFQLRIPGSDAPITLVSARTLNKLTKGWMGAAPGQRSRAYKAIADQDGWIGSTFRKLADKSWNRHLPPAMAAVMEQVKYGFENQNRGITKLEADMYAITRANLGDYDEHRKAYAQMDEYFEFADYEETGNKSHFYREKLKADGTYDTILSERAISQAELATDLLKKIEKEDKLAGIYYKGKENYKPKYRELVQEFRTRNELNTQNKRQLGGLASARPAKALDYDAQSATFDTLLASKDPSKYIARRIGDSMRAHAEREFLDAVKKTMTSEILAQGHSSGLGTAFGLSKRFGADGKTKAIGASDASWLLEGHTKMSEATIAFREVLRKLDYGEFPNTNLRISDDVIDEVRDQFNPNFIDANKPKMWENPDGRPMSRMGLFMAEGQTEGVRMSAVSELIDSLTDNYKNINVKDAFNLGATVLPRPYVMDFIQTVLSTGGLKKKTGNFTPTSLRGIDLAANTKGTNFLKDIIEQPDINDIDIIAGTAGKSVTPDELLAGLAEIHKADPQFFGSKGFREALRGLKSELGSTKAYTSIRADKAFGLEDMYGMGAKSQAAYNKVLDDILGEAFEEGAPENILKLMNQVMSNKNLAWDNELDLFRSAVHMDSRSAAWMLPESVADMLNNVVRVGGQGEKSLAMKGVRKALNWWKGVATRYTPGYWMRNKMGAVANMGLGGMVDPRDHWRLGNVAGQIDSYMRKQERFELHTALRTPGAADMAPKIEDYANIQMREIDGLQKPTIVVNDDMEFDLNDLWDNELNAKGVRHTGLMGADFEKTIEDYQKMELRKFQPQNIWDAAWGTRDRAFDFLESHFEDRDKISFYLWNLENGASSNEAVKQVKDFLFNYADIGDWDRRYGKFALPFWTWTKKNTTLQVRRAYEAPGAFAAFGDVSRNSEIAAEFSAEDRSLMPDYTSKLSAFGIPNPLEAAKKAGFDFNKLPVLGGMMDSLASGPLMINPNVPIQELARLPFDSDGLNAQPVLSAVHPFLRGPMELMLNHSVYYERPIEPGKEYGERLWVDMPPLYQTINSMTGQNMDLLTGANTRTRIAQYSPKNRSSIQWTGTAAHVVGQLLPPLAQFSEIGASDTKSISSAGSTLGGIKLISFDKEKELTNAGFAEAKRLQAAIQDARRRGSIAPTEEAMEAYRARLRTGGY